MSDKFKPGQEVMMLGMLQHGDRKDMRGTIIKLSKKPGIWKVKLDQHEFDWLESKLQDAQTYWDAKNARKD